MAALSPLNDQEARLAYEYADLAHAVYRADEKDHQAPDGWQTVPIPEGVPHADPWSGFQAAVYRSEKDDRLVVCFAGTFEPSLTDWYTNFKQAQGKIPEQYKQAAKLTQWARSLAREEGRQVHLTGHSLGGGLATYVALKNRLPAYCYNPADLGAGTRRDVGIEGRRAAQELVINFRVDGELLSKDKGVVSTVQKGVKVLGSRLGNFSTRPLGREFILPKDSSIVGHYMPSIKRRLKEAKPVAPPKIGPAPQFPSAEKVEALKKAVSSISEEISK